MGQAGGDGEPRRIRYRKDFKNRVKKVFPNNETLHELLRRGSERVGMYLHSCMRIEPEEVLWAIRTRNIKKLVSYCRKLVHRHLLYEEWLRIERRQMDDDCNADFE